MLVFQIGDVYFLANFYLTFDERHLELFYRKVMMLFAFLLQLIDMFYH